MSTVDMDLGARVEGDSRLKPSELVAVAQLAETLGYHSFWLDEALARDAVSRLALVAAATRRIKLGILFDCFSRSPTLVAQTAATLDELSGGRLILGIAGPGTVDLGLIEGWHGQECVMAQRRLKEFVQVLRLVLRGEPVDFQGRAFRLQGFRLGFRPLRSPIPIFVAALGPSHVQAAGEVADGLLPTYLPPRALPFYQRQLEVGAQRQGRDPSLLTVAPYVLACADGRPARARTILRWHLASYIGGAAAYYHREVIMRYGYGREATSVRALWARGRYREAAQRIPAGLIDAFAVVGTAERCRQEFLRRWGERRVYPIVSLPFLAPPPTVETTLGAFADASTALSME